MSMRCSKVLLALAIALAAGGCTSPDEPRSGTAPAASVGVKCDKCGTVWVQEPNGKLRTHKVPRMRCPDCEDAVIHFFKTGELRHYCSHCEGTLQTCDAD